MSPNEPTSNSSTSSSFLRGLVQRRTESWKLADVVYRRMIFVWCRSAGCSQADAEEIAQETMVRVVGSVDGFEHSGRRGAFRAWLRGIAANLTVDHFRAVGRQVPVGTGDSSLRAAHPGGLREPQPGLDCDESWVLIEAICDISRVNENTARSFVEYVICGRDVVDIAADAPKPMQPQTVYKHVKRTGEALRGRLDEDNLSGFLRRVFGSRDQEDFHQ